MLTRTPGTAWILSGALSLLVAGLLSAQGSKSDLKETLGDVDLVGEWVYDDFAEGLRLAKESGKPLLVVFRCIP